MFGRSLIYMDEADGICSLVFVLHSCKFMAQNLSKTLFCHGISVYFISNKNCIKNQFETNHNCHFPILCDDHLQKMLHKSIRNQSEKKTKGFYESRRMNDVSLKFFMTECHQYVSAFDWMSLMLRTNLIDQRRCLGAWEFRSIYWGHNQIGWI